MKKNNNLDHAQLNLIYQNIDDMMPLLHEPSNLLLDFLLEKAIQLTSSQMGYIYFYNNEKKEFTLHSWSKGVMQICSIVNPKTIYQLDKTGIWGEAVRQNQPIMINDFQAYHPLKKGYPEGHAPLYRFLSIPIRNKDEIVAVVGVGNKSSLYDEVDILNLELLMKIAWKIIDYKLTLEINTQPLSRYRDMFNSCSIGIALYNDKEQLIESNSTFDQMLFIAQDSAIKRKNIENLHHLFALFSINSDQKNDLMNGKSICFEKYLSSDLSKEIPWYDFNYSKAHRCFEITVCPLKASISTKDKGFMVQMMDISCQKNIEIMKNEFVSTVSHEFRTPLTVIKGSMDIISMKMENDNKDILHCFQIAKRNIARLENLINDILDYQQHDHEKAVHCYDENCINEIVKESVGDLEAHAQKKGLTLSMKLDSINPFAYCNKERIMQVLVNLISNAIKFTHHGGITISTKKHNDEIIISVKDTGIGINPEDIPMLFNFFTQLKHSKSNNSGGSGLGLAISKKIIDNHQGKIWVNSIPNEGSTFYFSLPKTDKEVSLEKPAG